MPLLVDPTAPRKKYALLKWVRRWNDAHPKDKIEVPATFKPGTEVVGNPARELLKEMQRRAKLPVSGNFNKATMAILLPIGVRGRVMATAHGELGVHEWPPGSNRGEVLKYLKAAGIGYGAPWCVSFVYWVLLHSGFERRQLPSGPASTPNWYTHAKKHGCLKPVKDSKLGDIWLWEWGNSDGMLDHGGFCDDTNPSDRIAYYLDGNVGAYGGSVTHGARSAQNIAACIDVVKLSRV